MLQEGFQLAIVTNEYGSVSGQVSLEDLMKRLVGQISDERGREAPDVTRLGNGRYRLNAALPIVELNEVLGVELPRNGWNTIGGLIYGLAGAIPAEGATVTVDNFQFSVELSRRPENRHRSCHRPVSRTPRKTTRLVVSPLVPAWPALFGLWSLSRKATPGE